MSSTRTASRFISVEKGIQIHVWDAGAEDAPALVFIPGLTFSGEVFMHQLEHFRGRYRVVLVDPRGQGLSDLQTPGGEQGGNANSAVFWNGLVDAIDFFHSSSVQPYPHNASCADS